ncbi:MAG: GH25 family lysozyme [Wujia sp.]
MIHRKIKQYFAFILAGIMIIMSLFVEQSLPFVKAEDEIEYIHAKQFHNCTVYNGVDVSQYNVPYNSDGTRRLIDWNKVKASGVEFAFVRLAYREWENGVLHEDTMGPVNCKGAKDAGLKIGVYIRSQATTVQEAIEEANYIVKIMRTNNIAVDLPVVMDYEYQSGPAGKLYNAHLTKQQATDVCMAFCDAIATKGYVPMVYANKSMLTNQLYADTISKKYPIWLAEWPKADKPQQATYDGAYSYWQYTSKGTVPGIEGAVDLDFFYSIDGSFSSSTPNIPVPTGDTAPEEAKIVYATHVQSYGWEKEESYDGGISGTVGSAKRLEAIKIRNNTDIEGSVEYQVHCQTYGWMDWVMDGDIAGMTGLSKRLEAIRIRLSGQLAETYDVYYRVHCQTYGWLGWAKNGQTAGSTNYAKRLEAIQIVLVEKGGEAPGDIRQYYKSPGKISYQTHVQTYGWQGLVYDGAISGTTGRAKRLEAITIQNITEFSGDIRYRVHVQTYGWQAWKKNGESAGTMGQAKRLEAIQIELSGDIADQYDIYYRVHAQTYGWLDWAKNGEPAGTAGYAKRLEAIQIVLVNKGAAAPGSTVRPYVGPDVSVP